MTHYPSKDINRLSNFTVQPAAAAVLLAGDSDLVPAVEEAVPYAPPPEAEPEGWFSRDMRI
jgi:hypothetical protein